MFSCEFYEISKNPFFYRTPLVAASCWNKAALKIHFRASFILVKLQTIDLQLN